MQEQWRPVVGREDDYEVSDLGRVRNKRTGHFLKPGAMSGGHVSVCIGKGNSRTVHSLVMDAFKGPPPDGMEILHKDGVKIHNMLFNLAYGTRGENTQDRKWHGTPRKLTVDEVRSIKKCLRDGVPQRSIAAAFSISRGLVSSIKAGKLHIDIA